ncbi:MAG: HupE/UreJ family protein [Deltaproteobacteria bacterium]|nr:HupE/UreJ family protein [Deltaproteobacteria bacterium]
MGRWLALAGFAVVSTLLLPRLSDAHTGALGAFELRAAGTQVVAGWNGDDFASQGGLSAPVLEGCEVQGASLWSCPDGLEGVAVVAEDLSERDGQIVVTLVGDRGQGVETVRSVLDPRAIRWDLPAAGAESSALAGYFIQGLHHIAGGIDHLVFVLGLLLLVPGLRALVGVITAFTLGHSVTLGVATVTGVAPASAPTEALIAGSILLLARELVISQREERDGRHPAGLAAVFGLVHGFGFSGALAEVGIPAQEMASALLGFNLGVEAGQLLFVLVLVGVGWGLSHAADRGFGRVRAAAPYAIGAIAAFWFVERVVGLG